MVVSPLSGPPSGRIDCGRHSSERDFLRVGGGRLLDRLWPGDVGQPTSCRSLDALLRQSDELSIRRASALHGAGRRRWVLAGVQSKSARRTPGSCTLRIRDHSVVRLLERPCVAPTDRVTPVMIAPRFDNVIHAPNRLRICAILAAVDSADFSTVRDGIGVSDSVLSKHIASLHASGYVAIRKSSCGARTRTTLSLSPAGRRAFKEHVSALHAITENNRQRR
jgi:hypothetical protein